MAASIAMIATTHTVSSSVNPSCAPTGLVIGRGRNIGRHPGSTFDAVGTVRNDFIRTVLSGRAVQISLAPRIVRHAAALEVRSVPGGESAGRLDERGKPLRARRISPGIEIEQLERAREALDLDLRGLDLRLAQVIEHARADERHDEADDRDHDQYFDEREAALVTFPRVPA